MEEVVDLLSPDQSEKIADSLSHLFPVLAISAGTVTLILVVYFIVAIVIRIKNNKRNIKMQNDIAAIRQIIEKKSEESPQVKHHEPEIRLADGAIKREEENRV